MGATLLELEQKVEFHTSNLNNPHRTTAAQTGGGGGGGGPITLSIVANDNLNAFDPVTITGYHADSGNTAHLGKVIGIIQTATNIGFAGNVTIEGSIQNAAWAWTPGAAIFLNGTSLSQTPPATGFIQQMGIAKASDTIVVDLFPSIKL